jgi:hypothetical protein
MMRDAKAEKLCILASPRRKAASPTGATSLNSPELDQIERPAGAPPGLATDLKPCRRRSRSPWPTPRLSPWAKKKVIVARAKTPEEAAALGVCQRSFFDKSKPSLVTG